MSHAACGRVFSPSLRKNNRFFFLKWVLRWAFFSFRIWYDMKKSRLARLPSGQKALPLLARWSWQVVQLRVPQPNHWCVMVHDWTADVSPAGHSVSARFIWTLPTFLPQRRRALTRCACVFKNLTEEGKGDEEKKKNWATSFKPSRFLPGSCRHQHPRYPPLSSLNGWGSLALCSPAQAERLETTCEYPSVWRLVGNAQKCPSASLELNSEDFSSAFAPFFSPGGRTLFKVYNRKEKSALKWQLSHYSPRYGLYVFVDVLFTQSSTFGSYFRCRNTWWVIHFLHFAVLLHCV